MSDRRLPIAAKQPTSTLTQMTSQLAACSASDRLPRCVFSHITHGSTKHRGT